MNINLLLDNKSSIDTGFTPWLSKYSLDNHGSNTEILQLNGFNKGSKLFAKFPNPINPTFELKSV